MKLLHFKCLKIRTKVSEAVSLLPLFNWKKKNCFQMNPLYFSSENVFSSAAALMCLSSFPALSQTHGVLWCHITPAWSVTPTLPSPKEEEKTQKQPCCPSHSSFPSNAVHDLNLASRLIHVCDNKSSQTYRLRSRKTQDGFTNCI